MSIDRRHGLLMPETVTSVSPGTLLERQPAIVSELMPLGGGDPGSAVGVLMAALGVAQALARAKGAALFLDTSDGLAHVVGTLDASQLRRAHDACVAASSDATSGTTSNLGKAASSDGITSVAVPLLHETCFVGVVYLEGLVDTSPRIEADVHRCADIIAVLLRSAASLTSTVRQAARAGTGPESR
jgi:hypothetical protein